MISALQLFLLLLSTSTVTKTAAVAYTTTIITTYIAAVTSITIYSAATTTTTLLLLLLILLLPALLLSLLELLLALQFFIDFYHIRATYRYYNTNSNADTKVLITLLVLLYYANKLTVLTNQHTPKHIINITPYNQYPNKQYITVYTHTHHIQTENSSSQWVAWYQWPHNLPPYIYLSNNEEPKDFFAFGLPGQIIFLFLSFFFAFY